MNEPTALLPEPDLPSRSASGSCRFGASLRAAFGGRERLREPPYLLLATASVAAKSSASYMSPWLPKPLDDHSAFSRKPKCQLSANNSTRGCPQSPGSSSQVESSVLSDLVGWPSLDRSHPSSSPIDRRAPGAVPKLNVVG